MILVMMIRYDSFIEQDLRIKTKLLQLSEVCHLSSRLSKQRKVRQRPTGHPPRQSAGMAPEARRSHR